MTRDTKIGLLVGLAFIIMIGILLSDHLTSATEPPQAQLAQAGDNVRSAVTTPGSADVAPPITSVPTTAQEVAPQQPVPTKQELTPKQPPVEIVQIGGAPPAEQSNPTSPQDSTAAQSAAPVRAVSDPHEPTNPPTPIARPTDPNIPGSIASIACEMGEELVTQDGEPVSDPPITVERPAGPTAALPAGAKQHKAEAGDSVTRMAARLMGGNTKANRDALIAANPSLQQNPNLVVVGRTYIIPAAGAAPASAAAPSAPTPVAPETIEPTIANSAEYFYTVKPGDNLTKISLTQLGTPNAVAAIKDLNKDLLKGSDIIQPNMKLRLPAKPLASAQ